MLDVSKNNSFGHKMNSKRNMYFNKNSTRIDDLPEDKKNTVRSLILKTITNGNDHYDNSMEGHLFDNLRVFDQNDDGLVLIHFIDNDEKMYTFMSKRVHGIIIDTKNKCVVADAMPDTPDIISEVPITVSKNGNLVYQDKQIFGDAVLELDCNAYRFMYAIEGTVMRLFYHNGKWHLSTHKKIDGTRSRWGNSPKFVDIILECVPDFWERVENFNKNMCYAFMVEHPSTRIVHSSEPKVTLINMFQRTDDGLMTITPVISYPDYYGFETNCHLRIDTIMHRDLSILPDREIIAYNMNSTGTSVMSCVKITSSRYAYLKSLRNNEPNLQLRYLVIQRDIKNPQMLADFVELFNDRVELFDELIGVDEKVADYLEQCYHIRYSEKKLLTLPSEEHHVLKAIAYKANRHIIKGNIRDAILDKLMTSNGRQLYSMYKNSKQFTR